MRETYISRYWPGDTLGGHLEFALKYDGTNLAILACIFRAADESEFTAYVQSRPTGKYARRLWYLYELLTGNRLTLGDLTRGSYVDLLKPEEYYTSLAARQVRRQRINDNLLGDGRFCPTVRRTETLRRFDAADLKQRCREVVATYPPELLKRALSYLYTKETKSSFEIEHIKPSANRTERFIALLQLAEREDFCDKAHLIGLQNRIVDPRFAATDFRKTQNYVGETVTWQQERVHFVCPRPEDLPGLMDGLTAMHPKIAAGGVPPVVHAALVAYGFVFLHPFEDGNGRIHRFLIHNILALGGFWRDEGVMLPVSAAMLKNPADYDASLEAFSRPLMPLVEYSLDDEGRMIVHNDTAVWYRYIDMTPQAEALFAFIEKTIDTELADELAFLANYDRTKAAIQSIVDMPDRQIDLFIRFCLQNHGRLSAGKRGSHFDFLTDDEVAEMEKTVRDAYGEGATSKGA
ncbi:MAG: Fic family protein [Pseudomonadota bacterium]